MADNRTVVYRMAGVSRVRRTARKSIPAPIVVKKEEVSNSKRQRSRSPSLSSVNQPPPEEQIPEGKFYVVLNKGGPGPTKIRSRRKRVKFPPFHGPIVKDEAVVFDTDDLKSEDIGEHPDSAVESSAPVEQLAFDPHPDDKLWEVLKDLYVIAVTESFTPRMQYTSFLCSVRNLYKRKQELGLEMVDDVWIQTTLGYFPDFTSWIKKKNEIVLLGPFKFFPFIRHMLVYVMTNMDVE